MNSLTSYYLICLTPSASTLFPSIPLILTKKHLALNPKTIIFSSFSELPPLFNLYKPKYVCFVAHAKEAGRDYVREVHLSCRGEDGFYNLYFGILTAPDHETAIKIASFDGQILIKNLLSGTEIMTSHFQTAKIYSEIKENQMLHKKEGGLLDNFLCPSDTTSLFVEDVNSNIPDLIITSGHATEQNWQMGYSYLNGSLVLASNNLLEGKDLDNKRHLIKSDNPKAYIGCGNCLIGHILEECMALAWMKNANTLMFAGYTKVTWYGFAGWGILKYFLEFPMRLTLNQAFFANQNLLMHYLSQKKQSNNDSEEEKFDLEGLEYDSDIFMVYGDPLTECRIENEQEDPFYKISLKKEKENEYIFEVECLQNCTWICPCADDRSTLPGRPPIYLFPERLINPQILEGDIILTDLFVFMPLEEPSKKGEVFRAKFRSDSA